MVFDPNDARDSRNEAQPRQGQGVSRHERKVRWHGLMKSLALHIQSALESLHDCLNDVNQAHSLVVKEEDAEMDPPVSSTALDRVVAQCLKAQRELQNLSTKVR